MSSETSKQKRGFTVLEKWVIWAVFCLLIGLSTHRFSVFLGLMLFSFGISLVYRRQNWLLGMMFSFLGLLSLIFSKYLI